MTSQINPNNIDGTYPVAGQPNNTQGMRDNFTNTKTNFQYASDEITELQSKSVLKSALSGSTLDNNMNNNLIYNVTLNDVCYTYLQNTATTGTITLDAAASGYQYVSTTGSVSLGFTNWCPAGSAGIMNFTINITNVAHTLTLPATVSLGLYGIQGISPGTPGVTNTITFGATGQYTFRFTTTDGGLTIDIFDFSRAYNQFAGNVYINGTSSSTSTTTGALQVVGGVGIQGNLNLGGNLVTYTSSGNIAFRSLTTGTVELNTPTIAANSIAALEIVGSSTNTYQAVRNAGSMIHITGNDNTAARVTVDTFGSGATAYPIFTSRRARGTASSPTAVQTGDVLSRFTASGWGTSDYALGAGNVAPTSIDFLALENFATANSGSSINFYTSPVGALTKTLSANITANVSTFPSVSATGNIVATGNILLADGGTMGYNTGAGGTIAQSGNKTATVILNKPSGEITMQNTALGGNTSVSFTFTNSTIGARDLLLLNIVGGVATPGTYNLDANCTSGSATITVRNITAGSLSEAIVLRYAVIRGSIA